MLAQSIDVKTSAVLAKVKKLLWSASNVPVEASASNQASIRAFTNDAGEALLVLPVPPGTPVIVSVKRGETVVHAAGQTSDGPSPAVVLSIPLEFSDYILPVGIGVGVIGIGIALYFVLRKK